MSFDKVMKVFAPNGRIYQIEYACKAAQSFGQTAISIRGTDSVVVCTQKKVPDALIVPTSVTNIFNIADDIGAVIVGNMNDARFVVQWLRQQAATFKMKFSYEIPVHVLASYLSAYLQKFSQYSGMRPFCVVVTLVGCDLELGPQCYRVDPSGQNIGFRAVATGNKDQEAMTQLEKHFKKAGEEGGQWSQKEAVQCAIKVLQAVCSTDFKANDIEVGFASNAEPRFRKLAENEVEAVLTEMHDAM